MPDDASSPAIFLGNFIHGWGQLWFFGRRPPKTLSRPKKVDFSERPIRRLGSSDWYVRHGHWFIDTNSAIVPKLRSMKLFASVGKVLSYFLAEGSGRRFRSCYRRRWRHVRKRIRNLLAMKVPRRQAIRHGKSRKSPSYMVKTIASGVGTTNAWLAEQGVLSLKSLGAELDHLR